MFYKKKFKEVQIKAFKRINTLQRKISSAMLVKGHFGNTFLDSIFAFSNNITIRKEQ